MSTQHSNWIWNSQAKWRSLGEPAEGWGACAEAMAEEGTQVMICSRTKADIERSTHGISQKTGSAVAFFAGHLDRADTAANLVTATMSRFGRLHVLVNNSGGPPLAKATNATKEQWVAAIRGSILYFARTSTAAVPHMRRQDSGRIINVLS